MNETSTLNIVPRQAPAKTIPYEALWRAYYDSLDDNGKKYFGGLNVLEQSRLLTNAIDKDINNDLIKKSITAANMDPTLSYELAVKDLDKVNVEDYNNLKQNLKTDLVNRTEALSTLSNKALQAQKIKETMGVGHMTDEEYLNWLQNIPNKKDPKASDVKLGSEIRTPYERLKAQTAFNRKLMNVPENTMDRNSGMNYLVNKDFYYGPDNTTVRNIDKVLSWIPGANAIVTSRQQGESSIHDDPDDRTWKGAGLQTVAVPAALIPGVGPAVSGGLGMLGTSVAKGERGENYTNAGLDYLGDVAVGTAVGGAGGKLIDKGLNFLINKGKTPLSIAQDKYDELVAPMLNGMKLSKDQMKSYSQQANSEYTNKINKAIQSGKLSGVDADAFEANREGPQYIVVPSEIFKNDAKLAELNEATDAATKRTDFLKKINKVTRPVKETETWIPQKLDEGGYDPTIKIARDINNARYQTKLDYEPKVIDWNEAAKAPNKTTIELIAEKPLWKGIKNSDRTFAQSIFKNIGYDRAGKGQQLNEAGSLAQHDFNMPILDQISNPKVKDFIIRNYTSPKEMARNVYDQADSYVAEANELYTRGELTGAKLKSLADQYVDWNTRLKATPELRHEYEKEFLSKFNTIRHVPEKSNWTRQPYTSVPEHMNQGVDVAKGISRQGDFIWSANGIRPNPRLASVAQYGSTDNQAPYTYLENMALKVRGRNTGDANPENLNDYNWGEALAHQANLEVPSKEAVSKYIARSDAEKLKNVTSNYEDMKSRYLIPTLQEVSDAEQALIKAKTKPKLVEVFKQPAGNIKYNPTGLSLTAPNEAVYYRKDALTEPEDKSRSEATANETSKAVKEAKKWLPFIYFDEAKKRGNYMPEYNIDYQLPRELKYE